jgi:hypothetical protein
VAGDQRGGVFVVGRNQPRRALASGFTAVEVVRWSPDGGEVWFGGTRASGAPQQIRAVTRSGRERLLVEAPGNLDLRDVSPRGQLLCSRATLWTEIRARFRSSAEEAELPAADLSFLSDLADDGRLVLGTDEGQGGGPSFSFYVQKTDGSPPVWLGEGDGQALSPDGRFALAVLLQSKPQQLVVAPTGAGETRTLEAGAVVRYTRAVWDSSGRRVVFAGIDGQDHERLYVQDVDGGPPRAVTSDGVTLAKLGRPVSPDDRRVVALGPDDVPALYPLAGGEPVAVPGLGEFDVPICWTPDGRELFVARYEDTPARIERVDVTSGRTRPWAAHGRGLASGLWGQNRILVTPDGASYAYSQVRRMSDLYLTSPLK